jgi:hypothetical protein
MNTLEGDLIFNAFLAAFTAPCTTLLAADATLDAIDLIPLVNPLIKFVPTDLKLEAKLDAADLAELIAFLTAVATPLALDLIPLAKLFINVLPDDVN